MLGVRTAFTRTLQKLTQATLHNIQQVLKTLVEFAVSPIAVDA